MTSSLNSHCSKSICCSPVFLSWSDFPPQNILGSACRQFWSLQQKVLLASGRQSPWILLTILEYSHNLHNNHMDPNVKYLAVKNPPFQSTVQKTIYLLSWYNSVYHTVCQAIKREVWALWYLLLILKSFPNDKIEWGIQVSSPAAPLLPLVDQVSAAGTITLSPKGSEETLNCDSASSYTVQESDHFPTQAFYLDIPVLYLL